MFVTRVLILLVFIFFLHNPFFSYANKLPITYSPVDNIAVYKRHFNTNLVTKNPDPSTPKPRKGLTFGRGNTIATGLILVITLLNIIVYKLRELQEANLAEELNSPSSLPSERSCRFFSLSEILMATNNFSDELVLGRGGFGKVYKGFIDNGTITVAIKRLNHMSKQGAREFWNEIEMLSKFRHSHLVSLIGYCQIGKEMIIVYEYMVHGTLADHLHKNGTKGCSGNSNLTWVQRLKICIGVARGLDYLHTGTGVIDRVIHRDVKSSNILLDENCAAKVSDFGMSKIGPANTSVTNVSTNVKGTFGYLDPEYFLTRKLTRKSDVYSFGVVLFEVLCGRPVIDLRLDNEQRGLAGWAQQNVKEGTLDQIVDPSLRGQILPDSLKTFGQIADQCLHMFSKNRPTMAEVVVTLELALTLQERVDSFVFEDFFNENQENPNSPSAQGVIIDLNNDLHEEAQKGDIVQAGDATRNEHPRAKPIKNRELRRIVRQAFLGMARVISGGKRNDDELKNRQLTYSEVLSITNNFERIIGKGGFGNVYHGYVGDTQVAVKMLPPSSTQGDKEFQAEATLLTSVHHRNLNTLVGYCNEGKNMGIIYEYMANGNLDQHLSDRNIHVLRWEERLQIATDAAQGLEYLHHGCKPPIVHRDVKSSNILLNEKFQAKLTDFGLSRAFLVEGDSHVSTVVVGTPGYLDPEYFATNRLTTKTDVYGYGIVLLEIITGRPAISKTRDRTHLVYWVTSMLQNGDISNIVDPRLKGDFEINSAWKAVELAMACASWVSSKRPTMDTVVMELKECLATVLMALRDNVEVSKDSIGLMSLNIDSGRDPGAR